MPAPKLNDTGERLARIETRVEHIGEAQAYQMKEQAGEKRASEITFAELKESVLQLRINSETQLKTLEAAHKRIDSVDADLRKIDAKVDSLATDMKDFKTKLQVYLSIGAGALTAFWAVFGSTVQRAVGGLFGQG